MCKTCSLQNSRKMVTLNKKIASFYKLLANQSRFLNKEVQRLHFPSLRIMPLDYDPVLIVVKLSWNLVSTLTSERSTRYAGTFTITAVPQG